MDEDKKNDQFDAALPLPGGDQARPSAQPTPKPDDINPAADLIRQKIEAAYANEPSLAIEAGEVGLLSPTTKLSKHQQFVNTLVNSGKSLADIQTAWHEYYQNLPDEQKHQVWREFYAMHAQTSQFAAATGQVAPALAEVAKPPIVLPRALKPVSKTLGEIHRQVIKKVPRARNYKPPKHIQSILFGLAAC